MLDLTTITDPDVIAGYLTDASNTHGHAERLVIPRSTEEVAAVVRHCQSEGIPLTVTAQRTSTTGGPVPHGGWLLSVEALDMVYAPDDVGAGVILGAHQEELESQGCCFPDRRRGMNVRSGPRSRAMPAGLAASALVRRGRGLRPSRLSSRRARCAGRTARRPSRLTGQGSSGPSPT